MEINYDKIPAHMREDMRGYIEEGHKDIGQFLPALLGNNLVKTYGSADDINKAAMPAWLDFLRWEIPTPCWGSPERVTRWQEDGGQNGMLARRRSQLEELAQRTATLGDKKTMEELEQTTALPSPMEEYEAVKKLAESMFSPVAFHIPESKEE